MPARHPIFRAYLNILIGLGILVLATGVLQRDAWTQTSDILKLLQKQQRLSASQGSSSLSVSPPMLFLQGPPGGIAEAQVTVFNGSPYDAVVQITPSEAREVGPGKTQNVSDLAFLPEDSWVRHTEIIPSAPFLPSQTEKTFTVRVKIPPSFKGVRYGSIAVGLAKVKIQTGTGKKEAAEAKGKYILVSGIGVTVGHGIIVQLTSGGELESDYQYEIEKVDITPPSAKTLLQVNATVKNSSLYILNAMVSCVVLNESNQMVTRLKPLAQTRIQPGSSGVLSASPSAALLPKGKYKVIVSVSGQKMPTRTMEKELFIHQ